VIFVHQIDERFLLAAGWHGRAVFEDDNPHDVAGRPGMLLLAIEGAANDENKACAWAIPLRIGCSRSNLRPFRFQEARRSKRSITS
jgi:hypothetical protein